MKKLFGAIVVATAIFGAVFASASVLPLSGGVIQSGSIVGVACQGAPIHISYHTQLNGQGVNEVDAVVLSGFNASCFGKQASVGVWHGTPPFSGITAFNTWGDISAPSQSFPFSVGGPTNPTAEWIDNVTVMIRD